MGTRRDRLPDALSVVGQFYDSIFDESCWAPACEAFADYCGGSAAAVIRANPMTGATEAQAMRVDPHYIGQYEEYYFAKEIRVPPSLKYDAGVVMTEAMLVDKKELLESEVYNDLLLPAGIPHFMFAWLTKSPTLIEAVAIENDLSRGAFQANAMERYREIMPHVTRALRVRRYLEGTHHSWAASRAVLDALPYGVVFLGPGSMVLDASRPADVMLRSQDAIAINKGRLRATSRADDAVLQAAIGRTGSKSGDRALSGSTVRISKRTRGGIAVHVVPLHPEGARCVLRTIVGMVVLVDPDHLPRSSIDVARIALRLTHAEARLASRLFQGEPLRVAADTLGVSINTAKSQLKAIYAKTECGSQAELARKLMMVAMVPSESSYSTRARKSGIPSVNSPGNAGGTGG